MINTAVKQSFEERFSTVRKLAQKNLVPEDQAHSMTLMDAKPGAFFSYMDQTYYVKEKAWYEETSEDFKTKQDYIVTELTCLCIETGETVYVEWEFDDELEIAVTLERTSFRHLTDEDGASVDEDDLDQIVKDKDVIIYKNENYWYEDDWAALYRRGEKEEKVYMYEFENETGTQFLTVEEWDSGSGKEEYRIYISTSVDPGQIILLAKGA